MSEDRKAQMRRVWVAVSAALLFALLTWLTLSSQRAEKSRQAAQAEEIHTMAVLNSTDQVLRAAQNAETGQRGYFLTRDRAFLQPLEEARQTLPHALAGLRELTLNEPGPAAIAKRIEELATSRLGQLDRSVQLLDAGNFSREGLLAYLRSGKQSMDNLRRELGALERAKQADLQRSRLQARRHEELASQWRAILTLFTLILGLLCAAALISQLRARGEAREQAIKARSEVILEAGRHLLQSVIDSSQNLLFVKTRRGEVLFANAEFMRVAQTPLEDLRGVPLPPAKGPEEAEALAAADRAALERGEHRAIELQLDVAGQPRWYRVEKNPWIRDGKIIGVIGIASDINETKTREHELELRVTERTAELKAALDTLRHEMAEREAAQESLRQLQKIESLGQLTGGIAHDFNNMLTVVINSLETLGRQLSGPNAKQLAPLVETALAGATSAADLTGRLLAFARQQKLEPTKVEINALVTRTRRLLTRTLGKNIAVVLDLDPAAGWVEVDNSQLENALVNLAVNARDAMPKGGRLSISTRRRGAEIEILVNDTGQGMTPDELSRVFDPFYTTKAVGMGTGLGLSQVHGFVAQSGGRISIQSTPSVGTMVCIDLPACAPPDQQAPARRSRKSRVGRGELVLLVEDEALVRVSSQASLQSLGYRVLSASNGYDALELLQTNPDIALLITDISMPGMDGRDLAEAARLLRPGIAVLLTTGHDQRKPVGDDTPVLAKPYLLDQLSRAIADVLQNAPPREQVLLPAHSGNHGGPGTETPTEAGDRPGTSG